MNSEVVKQQLSSLRMPTASRELDEIVANRRAHVHFDWISELLEREIDARRERAATVRIVGACKKI